ncbi:MAG: enamine deaminase RidA [Rhodospirillaceae bacterium]|nr:enamine deaminase RidA [Rhodospirillaceae bacterium]
MAREHVDIDTDFYKDLPYASGMVVSGPLLYTAGMTARDDDGNLVGPGDMAKQFEQIFMRLGQIAAGAGTDFDLMVKITIFVTDIDRAYADSSQWRQYFSGRPASTLVEVSALKSPDVLVEIEAVFEVPSR